MRILLAAAVAGLLAPAVLLVPGCSPSDRGHGTETAAAVPVPRASLEGVEGPVARRIGQSIAAVEAAPGSAAAWGLLGMDYQVHAFFDEAARCYQQASALDPSDERWPYLAAVSLQAIDPSRAIPWYRKAEALAPDRAPLLVSMGSALMDAGDLDGAAEAFGKARVEGPSLPWALHGLAQVALRRGRPAEAASLLDDAVEAAPYIGEIHKLRAQVLNRLGRREEAEVAALAAAAYPGETALHDPFLQEMRDRGVSSQSWTRRGLRLEKEGELDQAEAAFRRVLAIRPGTARDHSNLGGVLARQGRIDEAIAEYRKGLEVDPGEAYLLNNLAMTLLRKGEVAEAERHLHDAMEADPSFTEAPYNLGLLRAQQRRPGEAETLFRKVLEMDPGHRGALNSLGTTLAATGRLDEALETWGRAVRIDPLNLDAQYNLAVGRIQQGRHADAVGQLEEALRFAPNSSLISRVLAWELATAPDAALRDGGRAVELASRVYGKYASMPQVIDLMAAALAEDGQLARAVAMAQEAVTAAEGSGQAGLARECRARLQLYRQGRPYHQPAAP